MMKREREKGSVLYSIQNNLTLAAALITTAGIPPAFYARRSAHCKDHLPEEVEVEEKKR